MESKSTSKERIAKNTMMLYIRMLLIMVVTLYTSRVVLNTLGVEDFGIYNVVGGFVSMLSFLNSAMATATQRFLSFEIGRNNIRRIRDVFSMSLNIHFVIALVIFLLAETVGLWFVTTQLTIPFERITAAKWVYQFSVLTMIVNIIRVPYTALIIAHERMKVFAWVGIIEVILMLLIVFLLSLSGYDKLKLYAVLVFIVSVVIQLTYRLYCKRVFNEASFRFFWDSILFKKLVSHVGWMLFGTTSNMLSGQGVNMLMNIFFGVTVNAARGIAYQINGAVNSFVSNFMIAVRPQIIKNYAQGDLPTMYNLVFNSSKFSFFLVFYISLPVLLLTNTILRWWLKIVPDQAVIFSQLVISNLFFAVLFSPLAAVSQATGRIKTYQLVISVGFYLVFGLSYLFFKLGYPSYSAFIVMIVLSFIGLIARLLILKFQVSFPIKKYIKEVLVRIIFVVIVSLPIPLLVLNSINRNTVAQFFAVLFTTILCTTTAIWVVGINKQERIYIQKKIAKIKYKIFN